MDRGCRGLKFGCIPNGPGLLVRGRRNRFDCARRLNLDFENSLTAYEQ